MPGLRLVRPARGRLARYIKTYNSYFLIAAPERAPLFGGSGGGWASILCYVTAETGLVFEKNVYI